MGNGDASMRRAAVGLVRCAGYEEYAAVRAAVRESFDLFGGIAALVRPGQRVLLKPNLLSALPAEAGVNTHPSVVRAVAEEALEAGGVVSIGDSPAFSRLDDTCAACGLDQVARELGIPIVPFNRPVWVPTRVPHGPARGFKVDRAVLDADVVINIPKLKSHGQLGFTAAAKNLYGCMPGKRKAWYHARMHGDRLFAAFLAAFAETVRPAFNLVDAILAMHRTGPKRGDLLPVGLLVGGSDPFAVDTFLSRLIAIPDADNLIVNAARRLGLGVTDPERIDFRGIDPATLPPIEFKHPMLVGTAFSLPRVVRSAWRSFIISRFRLPENP